MASEPGTMPVCHSIPQTNSSCFIVILGAGNACTLTGGQQKQACGIFSFYCTLYLPKGKVRPADRLQIKAASIPPFAGLAKSKQDPLNHRRSCARYYTIPLQPGQCRVTSPQICFKRIFKLRAYPNYSAHLQPGASFLQVPAVEILIYQGFHLGDTNPFNFSAIMAPHAGDTGRLEDPRTIGQITKHHTTFKSGAPL